MGNTGTVVLLDLLQTSRGIAKDRERVDLFDRGRGEKLPDPGKGIIPADARFDPGLRPAAKLPFHPGFSLLEGLLGGIRHVGPEHMRQIIGGLAMPGRGEGLPVARQLRGNFLWRGAGGKRSGAEGVAPFRNLFSRPRRGSRYPDRRSGLLHGPWQQGDVLIMVKLALI